MPSLLLSSSDYKKPSPLGKVDFSSPPRDDEKDGRGVTAVRIRRRVTVKLWIVPRLSRPLRGHPPQRGGLYRRLSTAQAANPISRFPSTVATK